MLENLLVRNFRSLSDFAVPKLGKVNLIVGKNNSGKSTVLEALRVYAKRANPLTLLDIATSHDEPTRPASGLRSEDGRLTEELIPFRAFFTDRRFPSKDNDEIYIGDADQKNFVKLAHTYYIDEYEEVQDPDEGILRRRKRIPIRKDSQLFEQVIAEQALLVTVNESSGQGWIELTGNAASALRRSSTLFWDRGARDIPLSFVPTQFLSLDLLAQLWDSILFTPYAEDVKAALQIVDERFDDLGFVVVDGDGERPRERFRLRPERTAKVKLRGYEAGIPLNSMGDGMLRVLQLVLTIFPAKGGLLLIDEFENGLHWSVQEKVWALIFRLATELNIQVFATTHSNDAIRSFSAVAQRRIEEGVLIRLTRRSKEGAGSDVISVAYDEDSLKVATESEIELR